MLKRRLAIAPEKFDAQVFNLLANEWMLLTAGDLGKFNSMTIAWGAFGVMWGKPMALVVLRPQRYTLEFLEAGDSFTLCAFPPEFKKALALLGSKSGRDGDKLKLTGLSPISSASVKAPGFEEADLIIECRKSYDGGAFDPKGFCDQALPAEVYPGKDYHKLFFGEILAIHGTEKYLAE